MIESSFIEILIDLMPVFLVMYVYPRFIFSFFLKDKSALYKIFFCFGTMVVWLSFLVIGLFFIFGSSQNLYFLIVFYGVISVCVIFKIFAYVRTYRTKSLIKILDWFVALWLRVKNAFCWSWVLLTLAIFLCMFTSVNHILNDNYFNFSDMYIHYEWVYNMLAGNIFSDGIYPFGMHCCLYAFTLVSNIDPYKIYMYLTFAQNFLIFISFYALCRVIFKSRYSACLPLLLFGLLYFFHIYGPQDFKLTSIAINRFLVCLPQEYCLFALFAGMAALIKFYRANYKHKSNKIKFSGCQYLVLYALCVASTITTHIYTTFFLLIATISICVCFAWKQNWRVNLSFVISGLLGVFAGVLPYVIYFIKFPKFEESIKWGLKVILGWRDLDFVSVAASDNSVSTVYEDSVYTSHSDSSSIDSTLSGDAPQVDMSDNSGVDFFAWIGDIYNNSIVPLFGPQLTPLFLILFFIAVALTIFVFVYALKKAKGQEIIVRTKLSKKDIVINNHDSSALCQNVNLTFLGYLSIFISLFLLYIFYASPVLGIPRLLESYRIVAELYFFYTLCLFFPVDLIQRFLTFR